MGNREMCLAAAFLYGFLQLHSALAISCQVTQDADLTTYTILDPSGDLDPNASGCEFSWTNTSNFVLANHIGKHALVMMSRIDTLVTSECFYDLILTRDCISEGNVYKAYCNASCTAAQKPKDEGFPVWIALVPAIAFTVLLAVSGTLLCRKFGDRRTCSCCQIGGLYNVVKTQNTDPRPVEVEMGTL